MPPSNNNNVNGANMPEDPSWFPRTTKKKETYTYTATNVQPQLLTKFTSQPFDIHQIKGTLMILFNTIENPWISIYIQLNTHQIAKVDYEIILVHPTNSNSNYSKSLSFEFSENNKLTGFDQFMKREEMKKYISRNNSLVFQIVVNKVLENNHAKNSHIVNEIDRINRLFKLEELNYDNTVHQSLIESFYFMPMLRRCILEIPRLNLQTGIESNPQQAKNWVRELQTIMYHLRKGREVTENRFTQAVNFSRHFSIEEYSQYDFDVIASKTIKQIASASSGISQKEMKHNFYIVENSTTNSNKNTNHEDMFCIEVDDKASGDLITYLKNNSDIIRKIEQFPPVLFISLPTSNIPKATSNAAFARDRYDNGESKVRGLLRTNQINFKEDFYFDEVLREDEAIDSRSNENHYVLYGVWMHEHSTHNILEGEFYTFLRPLDQPHWVKITNTGTEEVHFNYVHGLGCRPKLPVLFDESSWIGKVTYAYMLVYVLQSEINKIFNERDSNFIVDLDSTLANEKKMSYSDINEIIKTNAPTTTTTTTTTTTSSSTKKKKKGGSNNMVLLEGNNLEDIYKGVSKLAPDVDDDIFSALTQLDSDLKIIQDDVEEEHPISSFDFNQSTTNNTKTSSNSTTSTTTTSNNSTNNSSNSSNNSKNTVTSNSNTNTNNNTSQFATISQSNTTSNFVNSRALELKLEKEIQELTKQNEKQRKDLESVRKNYETLKKDTEKTKKDAEEVKKQLEQTNDRLKKANKEKESTKRDADSQKSLVANQNKQLDALKKELNSTRNTKTTLEQELSTALTQLETERKRKSEPVDVKSLQSRFNQLELENKKYRGDKVILGSMDIDQLLYLSLNLSKSLYTVQEQIASVNQSKTCIICMETHRNICFNPCGHLVTCSKCSTGLTKCPMCRKDIKDYIKVISN